jgi:signal transduction histidine kinase/ActR/RegA family two-component response regulator
MDHLKTIELLKKKIIREQTTRKAAEQLLEAKSTELYYSKKLFEDSLVKVTEKSDQDVQLLIFKNTLEAILLHYSSLLLQSSPDDALVRNLLVDLVKIDNIKMVHFTSTITLLDNKYLQAGQSSKLYEAKGNAESYEWLGGDTQLVTLLRVEGESVGEIHFVFSEQPNPKWHSTMEKQCCLISEMISAAFHRQLLLDKTIKEKLRAEKSDRSTRDFVAMINHELRTPLNGLLGAAELIEETSITSYQKKLLSTVHEAGEMLRVIINDILDVSKINAGMLELKVAKFSPITLIDTITQIFAAQTKDKGLYFESDVDKMLPKLLIGDADRIKQILVNLIGNSVKFTSKGGIKFTVSWRENALLLYISDSGCGIPLDKQASLFDPFTQVDNSSQRKFEGTGLGLSICKLLVEMMEGNLSFTSKLDEGTEFTIRIPLEAYIDINNDEAIEEAGIADSDFCIEQLKILAVEDIKINQTILGMMLKKIGIEHQFSDDGQQAIDCLKENEFDIILMDCRMPVLDGFKATAHLRAHGYTKPIIALTAGTTSMEMQECIDSGMDDIVHKPYKREELEVALKKWGSKLEKLEKG